MGAIKQWATAICFVAVAVSIVEMLIPNGKTEKIMRLVLGCFMLLAIMLPLKNGLSGIAPKFKKHDPLTDYSEFSKNIQDQSVNSIKSSLNSIIENSLKEKKIVVKKVDIFMDTNKDNCISIKKIKVFLKKNDENKISAAKEILEKKLGLPTEVLTGDD